MRLLCISWCRQVVVSRYLSNMVHLCRAEAVRHATARRWLAVVYHASASHRWWVYPCTACWWNTYVLGMWSEEHLIENFCMSKTTFDILVLSLRPSLQHQVTRMSVPVCVEEHVAIAIWWLVTQFATGFLGSFLDSQDPLFPG